MDYKRKVQTRSQKKKNCCSKKAIIITYSECVFVTSVIQHAERMRRILLQFVACLILPYIFPYYLINGMISRKKKVTEIKYVLIYTTNFVWNISDSKKN